MAKSIDFRGLTYLIFSLLTAIAASILNTIFDLAPPYLMGIAMMWC